MALNAKPAILYDNVYERGTVTATDTEAGTDVANTFDRRRNTLWKGDTSGTKHLTVDMNEVENPGFETGDYTGWTQNDAAISAANPNSGTEASRMTPAGAGEIGAECDMIAVNTDKTYRVKAKVDVSVLTGGNYLLGLAFYDSGDNLIGGASTLLSKTGTTAGYESVSKSVGPASASPDISFPAGTASISIQDIWLPGSTGTSDLDDVLFYEEISPEALQIVGHNWWGANATIELDWSNDETEVIAAWTNIVAGFTPASDKTFAKLFTSVGPKRAWRVEIVTANLEAYVGQVLLGPLLEMEKYTRGGFDPQPRQALKSINVTGTGDPLAVDRVSVKARETMTFQDVTDSWYRDTFLPAYIEHLEESPFGLIWDRTNHLADAYYVWLPANFNLRAAYTPSRRELSLIFHWKVET